MSNDQNMEGVEVDYEST